MTKVFTISGLTADNIATLIAVTGNDEKLRKSIVKQFTDQATEADVTVKKSASSAPAKDEAPKPKAPSRKPAKASEGKPSKRAVAERIKRAKASMGKALTSGDGAKATELKDKIAADEALLATL